MDVAADSTMDEHSRKRKSAPDEGKAAERAKKKKPESKTLVWEGPPDDMELPNPNWKTWPTGWMKRVFQRQSGKYAGIRDRYWYSPSGKQFRSMDEMKRQFQNNENTNNGEEQRNDKAKKPTKKAPEYKDEKRRNKAAVKRKKLLENAKEEARREVEVDKEEILRLVPPDIQKMWGQVGFAKWNKSYLPALNLCPYDVPPGPVRQMWMDMFEKMRKNGHPLEKMSYLVYWYGSENGAYYYSITANSNFVKYDVAPDKMKDFAKKAKEKHMHSEKLSAEDKQMLRALKEVEEDLAESSCVKKHRGDLAFKEGHELLTFSDVDEVLEAQAHQTTDESAQDDDAKELPVVEVAEKSTAKTDQTTPTLIDNQSDALSCIADRQCPIRKLYEAVTRVGIDGIKAAFVNKRQSTNHIGRVTKVMKQVERLVGLGFAVNDVLDAVEKFQAGMAISTVADRLQNLKAPDIDRLLGNGKCAEPKPEANGARKTRTVTPVKRDEAKATNKKRANNENASKKGDDGLKEKLVKASTEINQLKSAVDKLSKEKQQAETSLKHLKESQTMEAQKVKDLQLDQLEKQVGSTTRENAKLNAMVETLKERLETVTKERDSAKAESEEQIGIEMRENAKLSALIETLKERLEAVTEERDEVTEKYKSYTVLDV
mmetsp:Transcript_20040/g.55306  ORF Transcript_20040/g.55306 Transcript_20040/m.55306 type:complete len:656 (+) Transcript_20040:54-2021(+)